MSDPFVLGNVDIDVVALASQGSALLGIRDTGKTYDATLLAEQFFEAGIPFTAFDPIGVWRFLRAPGKGRGYPVVVAGGMVGDLPLTPDNAGEIMRAAMKARISIVFDLFSFELSKSDWRKIVLECVRVLLYENAAYGLRHVFLEEAAEFIPQVVRDGVLYAEVEKLARMGGNVRLGYTLINQRAEEVNKAVLELCDNLFLHRQKGKNSIQSLTKWLMVANVSDPTEITKSLPLLKQGECWMWLAGHDKPVRVQFPLKNSFHPDRRSMVGSAAVAEAPPIGGDPAAFVKQMRDALLSAETTDKVPAAKPSDVTALRKAEERGYERGRAVGRTEGIQSVGAKLAEIHASVGRWLGEFEDVSGAHFIGDEPFRTIVVPEERTPTIVPKPTAPTMPPAAGGRLPGAAGKLLAKMDTNPPVKRTWGQFATLAGIKARGGHFATGKKYLVDNGLVVEDGGLVSIAQPSSSATKPTSDPAENVALWKPLLSACAPSILQRLYDVGGSETAAGIAEALGLAPRGGHWATGWKELRDNDIVTMSGEVATLTELFHPRTRRRAA